MDKPPPPGPFEISFGTAEHGWLPVALRVGDFPIDLCASNVLNDPLTELAGIAVALTGTGAVDLTVKDWEEPDWTDLRFVSGNSSPRVTIELTQRHTSVLAKATGSRAEVAAELIAALSGFERKLAHTAVVPGWGVFPSQLLRRARPDVKRGSFSYPWIAAVNLQRAVDELYAEVGAHHPLSGVQARILAWREDVDDYLFELQTGWAQLAVVHLTWKGSREKSPNSPASRFFASWTDWSAQAQ